MSNKPGNKLIIILFFILFFVLLNMSAPPPEYAFLVHAIIRVAFFFLCWIVIWRRID